MYSRAIIGYNITIKTATTRRAKDEKKKERKYGDENGHSKKAISPAAVAFAAAQIVVCPPMC